MNSKENIKLKLYYDIAFKSIFLTFTNILYQMISDITNINYNELKSNAIIFNSELEIKHVLSKRMISDLVILCNNKIINIEINKSYRNWTYNRNISYLCNIYSSTLKKSIDYNEFTNYELYQINFNIGKKTNDNYSKDMIVDTKTCKIVTNILKIYNINIDNCYKVLYNEEKKGKISKIIKWGALFNASTIDEINNILGGILMYKEREELIKEIKKKDGMFTLENLWDYDAEDKRIENTIRNEAYNEGISKGISQGIEKGTKHIILNMLNNNYSYDEISKITGLDKSKIKTFIL